jgi:hypothetical protein
MVVIYCGKKFYNIGPWRGSSYFRGVRGIEMFAAIPIPVEGLFTWKVRAVRGGAVARIRKY